MKILDRYIFNEVTRSMLGVMFISTIVMLVYRIIEVFEDVMQNTPDFHYVLLYFINILPFDIVQILPLGLAIAILISIGHLSKNFEILSMFSSGISPLRIIQPLLLFSIIVTISMFFLNEFIVPECQHRAKYIEKAYIEGKGQKIITKNMNAYQKGRGKRFYQLQDYDAQNKIMSGVNIYEINEPNESFKWLLIADRGEFIGGDNNNLWRFYGTSEWEYDNNGKVKSYKKYNVPIDRALEERADEFFGANRKPEEMNIIQLANHISLLSSTGEETGHLQSEWHLKIAFPISNIIIVVFCFALAIRATFQTLMVGVAVGLFLTILFYASVAFFRMLGNNLIISPLIAAWGANLIFLFLGTLLHAQNR